MSREGLAWILGRACLDDKFDQMLSKQGSAACARDMKVALTQKEAAFLSKAQRCLEEFEKCRKHRHGGTGHWDFAG